jgi:hypothetical protein
MKDKGALCQDDKIWLNDIYFQHFKREFNRDCDNCVNDAFWQLYDKALEFELTQKLT